MGVRGELFSTRLACDGRTYFFNVKENRVGDLFLTVVESKPTETGDFDRRSIVVFQESAGDFLKAFQKSLEAMEEAAPSARTPKPPRVRRDARLPRDDGRDETKRLADDERPRHYINTGKPRGAGKPDDAAPAGRDGQRSASRPAHGPNDDRRKQAGRTGTGRVLRVRTKPTPDGKSPSDKPTRRSGS
ncbi:MAG: DUF3276 family protein [Spirochaetales bacterium]|nr:DUF3276 family protein [Spirochaetales bacterium]